MRADGSLKSACGDAGLDPQARRDAAERAGVQRLDLLALRGGGRAQADRRAAPDLPAGDAALTACTSRSVQFVDTPVDRDGEVARLAGGMQWFAAYEVIEDDKRRTMSVAEFDKTLGADDERAAKLHAAITAPRAPLVLGERTLRFDQPQVAGILNVTPDSFSDGGEQARSCRARGVAMAAAGAALIDVGGESTRPGAAIVWEGDEIARTDPVVAGSRKAGTLVSIDTRKAAVMEAALAGGRGDRQRRVGAAVGRPRAGGGGEGRLPGRADALARPGQGPARRRRLWRRADRGVRLARGADRGGGRGRGRSREDHRRSGHRLRQVARRQSRAAQRAGACSTASAARSCSAPAASG